MKMIFVLWTGQSYFFLTGQGLVTAHSDTWHGTSGHLYLSMLTCSDVWKKLCGTMKTNGFRYSVF